MSGLPSQRQSFKQTLEDRSSKMSWVMGLMTLEMRIGGFIFYVMCFLLVVVSYRSHFSIDKIWFLIVSSERKRYRMEQGHERYKVG